MDKKKLNQESKEKVSGGTYLADGEQDNPAWILKDENGPLILKDDNGSTENNLGHERKING